MSLMYEVNALNAAMIKAAEVCRQDMPEGDKVNAVLACFAGMKPVEAEPPRWFSVEERLPEYGDDVAIIIRFGENYTLRVGWLRHTGTWFQAGLGVIEGKVTHWMPLPEPPQEVGT